jgi:hypothetical protein
MRRAGGAATAEGVVGAGQGIDAVVVCSVGKGAQLIEEVLAVAPADDREQAVLCSGRNRTGTNVLCSGDTFAADAVTAQDVALVAIDERLAGGTRFLLDPDRDPAAVPLGGRGDQLLDRARCLRTLTMSLM